VRGAEDSIEERGATVRARLAASVTSGDESEVPGLFKVTVGARTPTTMASSVALRRPPMSRLSHAILIGMFVASTYIVQNIDAGQRCGSIFMNNDF
jgi:hypothetical protein